MADLDQQRYPVGRFDKRAPADARARAALIDSIAATPAHLRSLVAGLSDEELDVRYRDGGWTIRQVVHHVPDSHMNGYVRMKLALTEENPTIKLYEESRWAELPDSRQPIGVSLDLLDAVHRRWVSLLRAVPEAQFQRTFMHPEWGQTTIDMALALYEWHGRHHTAHVRAAVERRARV